MRIKNLTNSPYAITNAKGEQIMIPARGEIEIDPHHTQEPFIRAAGYFEVKESQVDPLDDLRSQYKELTEKDADKRWSEKRLQEEIDKALE